MMYAAPLGSTPGPKRTQDTYRKREGLALVFLEWQLNAPKLFVPRNRFL